jgi:hypothetical protein
MSIRELDLYKFLRFLNILSSEIYLYLYIYNVLKLIILYFILIKILK